MSDPDLLILATNDDGIHAPGLQGLVGQMEALGKVVVVAPDRERSASSQSLTIHRPLRVVEHGPGRYALTGTPADCVIFACRRLLECPPDLVVSGINHGANLGDDIIYSGTVGAAREAALNEIPGFAFSLVTREQEPDFSAACTLARRLVEELPPMPPGTFLNINIPEGKPVDYRFTRQGSRRIMGSIDEKRDPRGRPCYWIRAQEKEWLEETDTDFEAVGQGLASVTPLQRDQTDYRLLRGFLDYRSDRSESRAGGLDVE